MTRAVPPHFHCCSSEELPPASFLVNDEPYSVPCVFQLWEQRESPRDMPAVVDAVGYTFVKLTAETERADPLLAIRRVGVRAGAACVVGPTDPLPSLQSHTFVRLDNLSRSAEIAAKLSAHTFPTNTTGPRSLSKGELSAVLTPWLSPGA